MDADGRLDEGAMRAHLDALIGAGIHGVVPAGSTGEVMTLTPDEYRRIITLTIEHVAGRVPVVAGCSANGTLQVIENCLRAQDSGADGLMITHPFYSRPSEDELFEHYAQIAGAVSLPIVIYNNPGVTGLDASPELIGRLSRLPHIEYVKESSGDSSRIGRILESAAGRTAVLSGTDHQALEHFAAGATGWVSASANVIPAQAAALFELAVEQQDFVRSRDLYRELQPFLSYTETSGRGIQAIKASMGLAGRPVGPVRPPLRSLPAAMFAEVTQHVERALRAQLPARARVA